MVHFIFRLRRKPCFCALFSLFIWRKISSSPNGSHFCRKANRIFTGVENSWFRRRMAFISSRHFSLYCHESSRNLWEETLFWIFDVVDCWIGFSTLYLSISELLDYLTLLTSSRSISGHISAPWKHRCLSICLLQAFQWNERNDGISN